MRLFRYLMQHKISLMLVFCLLVVQVIADLSLPNFTADIVNVGIQQGGIEEVSTTMLSRDTYDQIDAIVQGEDKELFHASYSYDEKEGCFVLTQTGQNNREQLSSAMLLGMILAHGDPQILQEYSSVLQAEVSGSTLPSSEEIKSSPNAKILEQQGLVAAQKEYEKLGQDTTAIQMDYLVKTGLVMLGLACVSMLVSIVIGFIASRTGTKIGRKLREQFFTRVVSFSDAEINSFSAASLITRGTNDIQLIQMVCIMLQRMVLYAPIMAVGGIIMVAQRTMSLWWVVGLAVVAVFAVVVLLMAFTMPKFKIMQSLIDKVNLVAREQLTGISVVRAFGREEYEQQRFEKANDHLMRTQLFTNRAMSLMMPAMMLVMNAVSVLIVWVGAGFVDQGSIQTGDLIALITYSMLIVMSFLMIGMVAVFLPRASVAAGRIDEVIATKPSIIDPTNRQAKIDSISEISQGVSIEFDHVSFSYGQNSDMVLEDISFTAQAGKTTAILGPTGSGKTTLIKLIERFYDTTQGTIFINGIDIKQIPLKELRGLFGYVPQKAFLFSGTIDSNVSYAGKVDEEQKKLALEIAQAKEFIDEKEEGINTPISQGGTNVSGGQRQRLAIARALASNAQGFLFDDSFSALDYKTDARLRQELSQKLKGRTVFIVAQRIATIMNADHIVVIDEGRVVGQGTHHQLLESCETYREIALSQLSEEELFGSNDVSCNLATNNVVANNDASNGASCNSTVSNAAESRFCEDKVSQEGLFSKPETLPLKGGEC